MFQRKIHSKIEQQLNYKEIVVLTGMRRVGKTTLLRMIYEKVESDNKIFLDIENLINQRIFEEIDFDNIWNNLSSLGIRKQKKHIYF
jgi:predicted AAA+ superfamily ATPase